MVIEFNVQECSGPSQYICSTGFVGFEGDEF